MSLWRQLTHGLRALTRRAETDHEVRDEVRHYLDEATAAHRARGMSADDALRAARLELGGVTQLEEQVRSAGWETGVETLFADLRYGARRLRATPGFTAITVLTLAVGIGATTAIFSALNPILFAPLPYPHGERIAMILETGSSGARGSGTFGMYHELAARSRAFEAMAVMKSWQPTGTGAAQPERFAGQLVSASYLRVLGVAPALGRDFAPSDDRASGPHVVILGDALWRRRFGGDPAIIGRPIALDDNSYIVIGVMPAGFENVPAPAAELWAPLQYDLSQPRAWGHHLGTMGRLRAGATMDQAARELDGLGQAVLTELRPASYDPGTRFTAASLRDDVTRGVKPALLVILAAATLVLIIACVNVTNLLIARGVQRRGEFALRAALGAGHRRLVRQLLTESLLLAAIGGVVGMTVAVLGVRALVMLAPPGLPRVGAIRVDGPVFAFGLVITTLIGVAFGVIPAWQAARSDPHRDLQQGTRRMAGGHRRTRAALVVAEVALALVLLVGSGLLLRSLQRLFAVDAGFDASRLLTMQIQTAGRRFASDSVRSRFYGQALDAVRATPGVTTAALTSQLPLSGDLDEYGARFVTQPTTQGHSVFRYAVSHGYTAMMGIPLRRGRALDENDRAGAPRVALISASLANGQFADADPIGQQVRIGGGDDTPPYTVVGVVGDIRQQSLALTPSDAIYTTMGQWRWTETAMSLVVRTRGDAARMVPAIRRAIWSVDKDQPIVRVATMDDLLAATAAERRFALMLFEAFALTALVLAAAGIYGVLSGSVAERMREIGVRSALGASRASILGLVLLQGMKLTALGAVIGVIGAALASRAIATLLFGVTRLDPVTYISVLALLVSVSALACWVPAWRAARVDPAITLRSE